MKKNLLWTLGLVTTMAAVGCTDTSDDGAVSTGTGDYGSQGLALTTDFLGNTDVVGMRYEIAKCGGDTVLSVDRDLEDLLLPGMIPAFEDKPFDAQSRHIFADKFVVLPAGCYDVKITPIKSGGYASSDCAAATAEDVMVVDQVTTEILLVSQCKGQERGALDIVGALNHPPIIKSLKYNPSKFITCGEYGKRPSVELCAKAYDPDSDPLEFEWTQVSGAPVYSGPTVVKHIRENGWEKQCVKIKLPYGSAGYEFELTVYDMFHSDLVSPTSTTPTNGLIRAETWFALNGYGDVDSHAKLRFPLYVSCEDPCAGETQNGDYHCKEYCYDKEGKKTKCYPDHCYDEQRHEIDCEVPDLTCPHSQGYWKNHNKYATNPSQNIPWPISEDTQLCGQSWLEILNTPVAGNAFYILGYQYIAARLNVANGGPTSTELLAKLAEAEALLNQCPSGDNGWDKETATSLASYLEEYNLNMLLECEENPNDVN